MNLFEINRAILDCYDYETGELDVERLEALEEEKEQKVENIACFYRNTVSDLEQLKEQKKIFEERIKAEENKAERLKNYLSYVLNGEKFKSPKVSVSFRNTKSVEVDDCFYSWAIATGNDELLRYKEPEPNKTAIKLALEDGSVKDIPARMVDKLSTIIK